MQKKKIVIIENKQDAQCNRYCQILKNITSFLLIDIGQF